MRLKIRHVSEYHYDAPVGYSLQRLRLSPQTGPGQKVINWNTTVDGAALEVRYNDHFDNHVELVSTTTERQSIRIVAEGEVETSDNAGIFGPHQSFTPLWLYRRTTPLTEAGPLITALAGSVTGDNDLSRMHGLMETVHRQVAFVAGETGATTTAEEALAQQTGVCQDHAHIMIAAARALGLSARYVSGYLMIDGENEQTASHAWAEVHMPGLGWVGFDAANDICPDDRYVRIATGLDYRDAAPVSGMVTGVATETLLVTLTVENQGQSQSQSQSQS
ncbi:transglutaminase family protein [Rhizobium sp. CFBP 8762]|uniref:transglutaminase family protein n=1 Tax=Rhizobium sp. CFBP 8762 TaxID=2775279 RepID=UPI00177E0A48|nr:transglutaminase family protein [Rhizobium sp. CFBP 8762]MBD8556551.1 transglutaminase family protein [Rhizobium sp. CFBP 8762]